MFRACVHSANTCHSKELSVHEEFGWYMMVDMQLLVTACSTAVHIMLVCMLSDSEDACNGDEGQGDLTRDHMA